MPDTRTTRQALHGVAECLMAGPQFRTTGSIRLRVSGPSFATTGPLGGPAWLRAEARGLLVGPAARPADAGARLVPWAGTFAQVAATAGVPYGPPAQAYPPASAASPDAPVAVDPGAAALLLAWFARGEQALRAFAAAQQPRVEPVLWPEHFDLGLTVAEVNYGVSPGDDQLDEPYAYVGPWEPREGPFWNASFGAARPASGLATVEAVRDFFAEGARLAARPGT